jgi:hypothetical protein
MADANFASCTDETNEHRIMEKRKKRVDKNGKNNYIKFIQTRF